MEKVILQGKRLTLPSNVSQGSGRRETETSVGLSPSSPRETKGRQAGDEVQNSSPSRLPLVSPRIPVRTRETRGRRVSPETSFQNPGDEFSSSLLVSPNPDIFEQGGPFVGALAMSDDSDLDDLIDGVPPGPRISSVHIADGTPGGRIASRDTEIFLLGSTNGPPPPRHGNDASRGGWRI